ncbi:MAG TPA: hypothetical protein VFF06_04120 [Polyangia bacterium]|nr:hypothetical protein [Polyangia bacterium]
MRASVALCVLWCGCSGEAPPLDELSLRDALRADPAIVVGLGAAERLQLADRFEEERERDRATAPQAVAPGSTAAQQVAAIDAPLEQRGEDAFVVARLELAERATLRAFTALKAEGAANGGEPLALDGPPAADATAADETRALAGRAGDVLRALVAQSGARRLERVKQWPIAAVVSGDTIYVNASWLAAMAALESDAARAGSGGGGRVRLPARRSSGWAPLPMPWDVPDGGTDDGGAELPDLSMPDLSMPDLASTDLAFTTTTTRTSGCGSSSCSTCDSCNKSCDNTTMDIQKSSDSCQQCQNNCAKNKCSVGGERTPFGTLAWLLLPAIYVGRRARRRS